MKREEEKMKTKAIQREKNVKERERRRWNEIERETERWTHGEKDFMESTNKVHYQNVE